MTGPPGQREASRRLPVIGARCLARLPDNLGAADLDLPVVRPRGFPATFVRDTSPSGRRRVAEGS